MDASDIKTMTERRLQELLAIDPAAKGFQMEHFTVKSIQAKIGMRYLFDRDIMARIQQSQMLRVIDFISKDSEERKGYILAAMPKMLPAPQKKK